jgi:hypothetical protein
MVSTTQKDWEKVFQKEVERKENETRGIGRGAPKTSKQTKAQTIAKYKNRQSRLVGKPVKLINKADEKKVQKITEEILKLHREIQTALLKSLQNAYAIGDLLFQQKEMIEHNHFTGWIKENMPISPRTAQRYMKLYEYKETLTEMHVETITEAYHMIFNWSTSDVVAEVNDSADDKGTITYSDDTVEKPKLPKHTTRGRTKQVEVSRKFIDDVVSGKVLDAGNEVYSKFVIEINRNIVASDTGDLIKALEPKLRPGGKIILVKK